MSYNIDRAIGCVIGFNCVIKAVHYVEEHERIPPSASGHLRRVLKAIYGKQMYSYYSHRRAKLRVAASNPRLLRSDSPRRRG